MFIDKNPTLVEWMTKGIAVAAGLSFALSGLSFVFGGVFKAISFTTTALKWLKVGQAAYLVSTAAGTTATGGFVAALKAMNLAFLTNPVFLIIAGLATAALLIYKYWEPIKAFFIGIWNKISGPLLIFWNFLKTIFFNFTPLGFIINNWSPITTFFSGLWDRVKKLFNVAFTVVKFLFLNFTPYGLIFKHWSKITTFFSGLWDGVKKIFSIAWQAIKFLFLNFTPYGLIIKHWSTILNFFGTLWQKVKDVFFTAVSWIGKLGSQFFNAGKNIVSAIWNGIKSMANKPIEAIQKIVKKIRDFLPFSPAKTGPLKDIHKIKLIETIAQSIKPNSLVNAVNDVMLKVNANMGNSTSGQQLNPFRTQSNLNFSPVINLSGPATKQDARNITESIKGEFKKLMKEYTSNQKRVSY